MATKVTIKAHNGVGDKKTLAGEKEVQKPLDVSEAVELYGPSEVLAGFWASYVIDVQREIRGGGKVSKLNKLIARARELKAAGDDELFNELVSLEIIKE
jgi:hypothetical protein